MIHTINEIETEKELLLYLASLGNNFNYAINKIIELVTGEKRKVEYVGCEYSLPYFQNGKKIYGGGRVDLMYSCDDYIVPIELKLKGTEKGIKQCNKYVELCEKLYPGYQTIGVLISSSGTMETEYREKEKVFCLNLKNINWGDNKWIYKTINNLPYTKRK